MSFRQGQVVLFFISLSTEGTRGSQRSCLGGPSHSPGLEGQNSVCASSWEARRVMSLQSRHWLDYDPVALVVLLVGMSAVALLALSI